MTAQPLATYEFSPKSMQLQNGYAWPYKNLYVNFVAM